MGVYTITVSANNGVGAAVTQTFTLTVSTGADLAVSIAASTSSLLAGTSILYTVVVTNNGPSPAENVTLGLSLVNEPLTTVFQQQIGGPAFTLSMTSTQVADVGGALAAGQTATFQITTLVNADTANGVVLPTTAVVSSPTYDPAPANNSATSSVAVVNAGVVMAPDPFNTALTDLICGTSYASSDSIVVNPASGGAVSVLFNGKSLGTFHPTGRIVMYSGVGNDSLSVNSAITLPAFLYAGSGNDSLTGGSGPNMLVGGSGRDVLTGGSGYNVEIAGTGASRLSAAANSSSLMIGGTLIYDHLEAALESILQEWSSPGVSLSQRVAALESGADSVAINSSTLNLSSVADQLFGASSELDWFLSAPGTNGKTGPTGVLNASSGSIVN